MRKSTLWNCRELVSSWISKHVILYLKKLKKLSFEKERGIFEKASLFFCIFLFLKLRGGWKSEYLICIGLLYSQEWNGQLSDASSAILQQHAAQGDLTELQVIALRWRALAQQAKDESLQIHFKVLFEALKDLEKHWDRDMLSNEEV